MSDTIEYDDAEQTPIGQYFRRSIEEMEKLRQTDPKRYEALRRFYRHQARTGERIMHDKKIRELLGTKQPKSDRDINSLDGLKPGDILEIEPPE